MDRRTVLAAVGTAATAGVAGCVGGLGRSARLPAGRRYERYVGASSRRVTFRSYVSWDAVEVTVDGERATLAPDADRIVLATVSVENFGDDPVSTPLVSDFELVAEGYEPVPVSDSVDGVDVDSVRRPERDAETTHVSAAHTRRPQSDIDPGGAVEYHLLYDTAEPPRSDYLLKFTPDDYEAGVNTAKPVYLTPA